MRYAGSLKQASIIVHCLGVRSSHGLHGWTIATDGTFAGAAAARNGIEPPTAALQSSPSACKYGQAWRSWVGVTALTLVQLSVGGHSWRLVGTGRKRLRILPYRSLLTCCTDHQAIMELQTSYGFIAYDAADHSATCMTGPDLAIGTLRTPQGAPRRHAPKCRDHRPGRPHLCPKLCVRGAEKWAVNSRKSSPALHGADVWVVIKGRFRRAARSGLASANGPYACASCRKR